MPRLHGRTDAEFRIARQILRLNSLVVLHGVTTAHKTVTLLTLLEAVQDKAYGTIAYGMDARVDTPLKRFKDGFAHALWILSRLATGLGSISIGLEHPSSMIGTHAVNELLKAMPLDLRAREVVFRPNLLERHGLVLKKVCVHEHAQRMLALAVEFRKEFIGVIHAHKSGVNHADCCNAESVGAMRSLGKGSTSHLGGRIVYLIHEKGSRVVREDPSGVASFILKNLAA